MKMIAASRLKRSQDRIMNARPFANQMRRVLNDLASRVDSEAHPLLALPEDKPGVPTLYIVITADRGLCGSFNTNIVREAGSLLLNSPRNEVALALIGRKGRDFFRRRGFDVRYEHVNLFSTLKYTDAQAVAQVAVEDFSSQAVDGVYLIYNEFKSVLQQRVVVEQLLPIPRFGETGIIVREKAATVVPSRTEQAAPGGPGYLYEPEPAEIFKTLLPRHVETQIFRALLESAAAENAARMTAMDAASKNASEMIDGLTLYMNKVRQAAITREIIEVVSGAQAL
jgi:F-type H+-transporting ATPase subunit gamma